MLRKTKLKETDLIIELLTDEGALLRAVAKGARKPKSSFASRLELGNSVELLCAPSRGLAIVQECRLVCARMGLRSDYEKLLAAEALLELLSKCAQEDLGYKRRRTLRQSSCSVARCRCRDSSVLAPQ